LSTVLKRTAPDVDGTISAVDDQLQRMGYPAVLSADWQKVRDTIAQEWTPDVVAAYQAAQPVPAEAQNG